MFAFKYILLLPLLATLAAPATVTADTRIIIGKPYYKNYNYQPRHYNSHADNYSKRHNFGKNSSAINPYLNRDYAIERGHDAQREILVRPSYSDRVNIRQRRFDQHQHPDLYRQGYKRGYQHGYNDAVTRQDRGYRLGNN